MRRLVASSLIVACATLATGCGLVDAATKDRPGKSIGSLQTFAAQDWEIQLPCDPLETTQDTPVEGRIEPLTLRVWSCEDADTAYLVSTAKLPADSRPVLERVARGAAQGVDGELVKSKPVTYAGIPARDVRIETSYEGEPATAFGRVMVREQVLYQLLVIEVGEHTTKAPELYRTIIDSLSFE